MILRVFAMWGQSRTILRVLLFIFGVRTILGIVFTAVYMSLNTHLSSMSWRIQSTLYTYPEPLFSSYGYPVTFLKSLSDLHYLLGPPTKPQCVFFDSAISSQRVAVDSRADSDRKGVSGNVQGNEPVAAQPVHKASCEARNYLFFYVRRLLSSTHLSSHLLYLQSLQLVVLPNPHAPSLTHSFPPSTRNLLSGTLEVVLSEDEFLGVSAPLVVSDYVAYFVSAIIVPRFIVDVRELYCRDLRGRCQGIDTGFGMFSQAVPSQVEMSAMEFAGIASGQDQRVEDGDPGTSEAIRSVVRDNAETRV